MDRTHLRFYTYETGAALLRSHGFELVHQRADGSFPLWRLRRLLHPALVRRVNNAACRLMPGLFGFQSLYVAKPA
jgi:hypothetical protein